MNPKIKFLAEQFPCREKELEQLESLFSENSQILPESVFIYGQPATGKTSVTCEYLKTTGFQLVHISCIECYTSRLLLDQILGSLVPSESPVKCDNFMDLVHQLKVARGQGFFKERSHVLVLDGVEHLLNLSDVVIQFFAKLQELTSIYSLSVVFISRVIPEKFNVSPTVVVHFPQYSKDDLAKIFKIFKPSDINDELYSTYISSALTVFLRTTRDVMEMKNLILKNVDKYVEPVIRGDSAPSDVLLLWRLVTPHLRASLNSAYLGITLEDEPSTVGNDPELITHKRLKAFDLPYYAKYFLIASYLASYNSPKHDRRLFMKNHGKQRKQAKKEKAKSKVSELLGPKAFSLDRLLAIFYAIMEEKASLTVNLMSQIASLVELRLLAKMGDGNIDNPKFKCLAGFDCVAAVADTLGFNVRKYLLD
ncbi:hypothetical protein GE061_017701 [Apolygus lucorum]|uniref:Orc1-like AAA ATPase domain-containing protein n=1 Tax=Apolygus lucorum TaxID=248454 RepID=A0A8S9XDV4_APOLU|nr:hypothetical protein GE061_017701 [Apolygus lucorum]